jgi:hypothetical protein
MILGSNSGLKKYHINERKKKFTTDQVKLFRLAAKQIFEHVVSQRKPYLLKFIKTS